MNRITKYFSSATLLLATVGHEADTERARLRACPITPDTPLDIYLDTALLLAITERSIRQITAAAANAPDDDQELFQPEIVRRQQFATWLRQQEAQQYVRLWPTATYDGVADELTEE